MKEGSIKFDASGNVYVTGVSYDATSQKDIVTMCYNSTGTQTWFYRYDGSGVNGDDEPIDMCVDKPNDLVWVTGSSYSTNGNKDITVLCFKAGAGALQWYAEHNGGANGDDYAAAIIEGPSQNVFVTGKSSEGSGDDMITLCWDNTGSQVWRTTTDGTSNANDWGTGIVLSGTNVVACGVLNNSSSNNDFTTIKYDGVGGSIIWQNDYDFNADVNEASDIAKDSLNNIVVVGAAINLSTYEYHTVMYDSTGTQLWVNVESTGASINYANPRLAMDTIADHFYIVGQKMKSTMDMWVYQIDPTGTTRWEKTVDGAVNGVDVSSDVAVGPWGQVYMIGNTENAGSNYDITTLRISQTPVYFPPDIVSNEKPSPGYLFYENKGQVHYQDTNIIANEVLFHNIEAYPFTFYQIDKISYKFHHVDTVLGGSDTTQRVDINMFHSNNLTTAYSYEPKHGKISFMQSGMQDAVVGIQGYQRYFIPNIYPSIDLHYYSNENGPKAYYVVKPWADPSSINWEITGASSHTIVSNKLQISGFNGKVNLGSASYLYDRLAWKCNDIDGNSNMDERWWEFL